MQWNVVHDAEDNAAEILKKILGSNLRTYRTGRGISQMALAEELGLDQRYYSGIERGEWNLTFETVGGIADKIGVHPLDLLTGHAPPPEDDEPYDTLPGVDLGQ